MSCPGRARCVGCGGNRCHGDRDLATPPGAAMSVGEYLVGWLAHARGRVRAVTYEGYEVLLRRHALAGAWRPAAHRADAAAGAEPVQQPARGRAGEGCPFRRLGAESAFGVDAGVRAGGALAAIGGEPCRRGAAAQAAAAATDRRRPTPCRPATRGGSRNAGRATGRDRGGDGDAPRRDPRACAGATSTKS